MTDETVPFKLQQGMNRLRLNAGVGWGEGVGLGYGGRVLLQEPEFSDNQRRPGDWEEEYKIVKDNVILHKSTVYLQFYLPGLIIVTFFIS